MCLVLNVFRKGKTNNMPSGTFLTQQNVVINDMAHEYGNLKHPAAILKIMQQVKLDFPRFLECCLEGPILPKSIEKPFVVICSGSGGFFSYSDWPNALWAAHCEGIFKEVQL